MEVQGRDVEPAPQRGPVGLVVAQAVLREQRERVPDPQPLVVQEVRQPDRSLLELGEGDGLPRVGHHQGRFVGSRGDVSSGVHVSSRLLDSLHHRDSGHTECQ